MPYTITWEPRGVYKQFNGVVTGAELLQSVNEIASDQRFSSLQYEVSDYLPAERTEFSQDALNEVRAIRIGSFMNNPHIKVAIITRDEEIQQRMASTIAARLTMHETRVYEAVADANGWLGRTSPA
jgi:hypothetical protein